MSHEIDADFPLPPPVDADSPTVPPVDADAPVAPTVDASIASVPVVSADIPAVPVVSADFPAVVPIDVDVPAVDPITVDAVGVTQRLFKGDAVTLYLRERPEVAFSSGLVTFHTSTVNADVLTEGRWLEMVITGQVDSGSTSGVNFELIVSFGANTFSFAVPFDFEVSSIDGYFSVSAKIYADRDNRQIWRLQGSAHSDPAGSADGARQTTLAESFVTSANAAVDNSLQLGARFTGGAPNGTVNRLTIYLYDDEVVAEASAGSGLTQVDRAKLDSVEWGAEINRPEGLTLWSFAAIQGSESLRTTDTLGATYVPLKTGILPRVAALNGGLIEIMVTGVATGVSNQMFFRIKHGRPDEVPLIAQATLPPFGDLEISTSQAMGGFSDFALHMYIYMGTQTSVASPPYDWGSGRHRVSALFTYINPSNAPVRDEYFNSTQFRFFRDGAPIDSTGFTFQGTELTLEMRANDNANAIFVDGTWAVFRGPQEMYGGGNLYHPN